MCIIIDRPANVEIPEDFFRRAYGANKDGWGIMWHGPRNPAEPDEEITTWAMKGVGAFDKFLEVYRMHPDRRVLVHFRLATSGSKKQPMAHPFEIVPADGFGGSWLMHNGVLPVEGRYASWSDTAEFAALLSDTVRKYPAAFRIEKFWRYLAKQTAGNRLALYHANGKVSRTGDWYKTEDGCYFSNASFATHHPDARVSVYNAQQVHCYGPEELDVVMERQTYYSSYNRTYGQYGVYGDEGYSVGTLHVDTPYGRGYDTWRNHQRDANVIGGDDEDVTAESETGGTCDVSVNRTDGNAIVSVTASLTSTPLTGQIAERGPRNQVGYTYATRIGTLCASFMRFGNKMRLERLDPESDGLIMWQLVHATSYGARYLQATFYKKPTQFIGAVDLVWESGEEPQADTGGAAGTVVDAVDGTEKTDGTAQDAAQETATESVTEPTQAQSETATAVIETPSDAEIAEAALVVAASDCLTTAMEEAAYQFEDKADTAVSAVAAHGRESRLSRINDPENDTLDLDRDGGDGDKEWDEASQYIDQGGSLWGDNSGEIVDLMEYPLTIKSIDNLDAYALEWVCEARPYEMTELILEFQLEIAKLRRDLNSGQSLAYKSAS